MPIQIIVYGMFYSVIIDSFDKSGSYNWSIKPYYCITVFQKAWVCFEKCESQLKSSANLRGKQRKNSLKSCFNCKVNAEKWNFIFLILPPDDYHESNRLDMGLKLC